MNKVLKLLGRINLKTIRFNLKYFPFKVALKLPVLIGKNVFLFKMNGTITINGPITTGLIQIGYGEVGITDFKRSRAVWVVDGNVTFNGRAFIMPGCKINVMQNAQLIIGDDFNMSVECTIIAQKKIQIGKHSGISWQSLVMDTDFHHIYDENGIEFNQPKEIIIGDNVWVGCKCTLLKGAEIPSGCIIAANSMVTKKLVGEKSIFGGNPVQVLKSNITWKY
jgi:acetyltransferase-like isoleucine patch superfamily enzyme